MPIFSSDPGNVAHVQAIVDNTAKKHDLNQDTYGNILISLTEAVTNAMRHGNCYDEGKNVKIDVCKEQSGLKIRVSDEGCGFDYENLPDPTEPDNLDKIGGRGVFLMQALSDEIQFKDNGSTVEMRFSL